MEVSHKFTRLKKIARKFYTTKTELEMLKELAAYDNTDIMDMFESDTLPTDTDGVRV